MTRDTAQSRLHPQAHCRKLQTRPQAIPVATTDTQRVVTTIPIHNTKTPKLKGTRLVMRRRKLRHIFQADLQIALARSQSKLTLPCASPSNFFLVDLRYFREHSFIFLTPLHTSPPLLCLDELPTHVAPFTRQIPLQQNSHVRPENQTARMPLLALRVHHHAALRSHPAPSHPRLGPRGAAYQLPGPVVRPLRQA